jgi:hypothetical protein
MPTPQRIKGQEVVNNIVSDGVLEDTLNSISEFNDEDMLEIKQLGYLGEVSNRGDSIYNGTKFDLSLHLQSQEWFRFKQKVIAKAQRTLPDLVFNVTVTYFFPNGDTPTVTYADVSWGPIPKNVASRGDYVKAKMEGFVSSVDENLV